ncbi:SIMPL domain-containing protein [Chitinophaga sp. Cy-1792]|uniref:SIMPL domain-containing protein n=1 Tax=Chitinophaga sp. Cy-1792 TaxID=2608339 RepID=UPI0014216324|nr:SIMPL domain-containing protein [Chitinophaga sp. Cy-1792]NIG52748.1 DUF541 domain-containing protein [Chitinophaga sp. Cy-1792]
MKQVIAFVAALVLYVNSYAQQLDKRDIQRTIEVTGSTEIQVVPDEIYFDISLKEYMKSREKIEIAILEKQLLQAVEAAGISKDNLTIDNVFGFGRNWVGSKKNPVEFLSSRNYKLKLQNLDKIDQILNAIDALGIEKASIASVNSTKMAMYRRQAKVQATKVAMEKATEMLAVIGAKLGQVITVTEVDEPNFLSSYKNTYSNSIMNNFMENENNSTDLNVKSIKVTAKVKATFAVL